MTAPDAPQDDGLAAVIAAGLRQCRHEDAPARLIHEDSIPHVTHMVAEQVRAHLEERLASDEVVEATARAILADDIAKGREEARAALAAVTEAIR